MAPYLLVVESDPELQRRIGDALKEASYELAAEAEAAWAKRSLQVRLPDGLIVDTSLSDGSGFAVAETLRRDPEAQRIPIFFVASRGRGQSHETEAKRRFAPARYLPVPFDTNTLLAQVLEALPPGLARPGVTPTPVEVSDRVTSDTAQRQERRKVEQEALTFGASDPELSGSLAKQPFARTLQRIHAKRLTGALLVAQGETKKIVYFTDGYPTFVRSNVLAECLGQLLLSRNLISKAALDESLRRLKAEKKPQGAVLVDMGLMSPYRLGRALVEQMEAKLFDLFSWRTGSFMFKDSLSAPGEVIQLDRTTAAIILEGIRRHYNEARLNAVLAPLAGQALAPSQDPWRRLQDMTTDAQEQAFINGIDGSRKLEALLDGGPIGRDKARLLLVAMVEAGMIEVARVAPRRAEARRPPPAFAHGEALPPPKSRSELAALLEAKRAQTPPDVLMVAPDADVATIEAAYERQAREFHPDRYRARSEAARELAERIFDRLGEARTALLPSDPARKRGAGLAGRADARAGGRGDARADARAGVGVQGVAAEQVYYAGVEHLRGRRYTQAVEAFRQASSLSPDQASYHAALGWALFRESPANAQAVGAGLAELRLAVTLDGKDPWVRVSLGRFLAETGYTDAAVSEFRAALALNPSLSDIEDEIRRLNGAG